MYYYNDIINGNKGYLFVAEMIEQGGMDYVMDTICHSWLLLTHGSFAHILSVN